MTEEDKREIKRLIDNREHPLLMQLMIMLILIGVLLIMEDITTIKTSLSVIEMNERDSTTSLITEDSIVVKGEMDLVVIDSVQAIKRAEFEKDMEHVKPVIKYN